MSALFDMAAMAESGNFVGGKVGRDEANLEQGERTLFFEILSAHFLLLLYTVLFGRKPANTMD